jgi:hypothetical protein
VLIERYIAWLRAAGLAANSRALALICLRAFLEHNRRHHWGRRARSDHRPTGPAPPLQPRARFVSEFAVAQLEQEANLAVLDPTGRHLVVVLVETCFRAQRRLLAAVQPDPR